ncbi:MFS transporter [Actinokineospora inagensis]|uniref:MFS transporter n=1 Tax=Actinokineospora inagensis TaxID=103730 RepID=UPI0003F748A8|nr:MFS transporter [Actinokineospora inagensis]
MIAHLESGGLTRRHWVVFAVCAAGAFLDSVDLQVMSLVAPVLLRAWALTPVQTGLLVSAAMLGMLVGSVLFGRVADRIGRRPAFQITVAVFGLAGASCALAADPVQLGVLRFVVGFGMGGFIPVDTALLHEFMPSGARARVLALWGLAFPLGALAATALARWLLPHVGWRGVFLAAAAPALLLLVARRAVPETPTYLLGRGRIAEAEAAVRWVTGTPVADPATLPPSPPVSPDLPASSGLGRARVLVCCLWFCWSFAYFGLILWLPTLLVLAGMPLAQVLGYGIGFQAAAIVGRIAVLPLLARWGPVAVVTTTACAAACLVLWFGVLPALPVLIAVGYALSMAQEGGFSGIVPLTPSLFPTHQRATTVGAANAAGRVAALLAPIVVGWFAGTDLYPVFVLFALCFLAAAVTAYAVLRPTRTTSGAPLAA